MSTKGLEVFDRTLQETYDWLQDLMSEMGWSDRHLAYNGLRAALQTLRDRMTPEEAVHFGAQLTMLIRGFYYEGWKLSDLPWKISRKEDFFERMREKVVDDNLGIDYEHLTRAVFKLVKNRISEGEVEDIELILPKELRELWPNHPDVS
jgi:uncharacterized protein (DUF2267 family)